MRPPYDNRTDFACRQQEKMLTDLAQALTDPDVIHPSMLGPLPPAPALLAWKAEQIGLLSGNELQSLQWHCAARHYLAPTYLHS